MNNQTASLTRQNRVLWNLVVALMAVLVAVASIATSLKVGGAVTTTKLKLAHDDGTTADLTADKLKLMIAEQQLAKALGHNLPKNTQHAKRDRPPE